MEPSNKKLTSLSSPGLPVKKQLLQHRSSFRNIQTEATRDTEQLLTVPSNLRREHVERKSFRSSRRDNPDAGPMYKRHIKEGDNQTRGVNLKIDNSTAVFEEDIILGKQSDKFGPKNLEDAVWSERHQGRRSSISLPDLREMSAYLVSSNAPGTPPPGRRLGGDKNKDREHYWDETGGEGSDSERSLDSNFEDETPVNFKYYPQDDHSQQQ